MKICVYLVMFLLVDPVLRIAGVAVSALYLLGLLVLGVALLVRRKAPSQNAPQWTETSSACGYLPVVFVPVSTAAQWSAMPERVEAAPGYAAARYPWSQQGQSQSAAAVAASERWIPPGGAPLWVNEGTR